jgi:ATP-dependent exoDNAse (exonuclease V) alpha subunit
MGQLGDTKQTEAIEAGKPFAQLQENGMQIARISEIQRQKEPQLKAAVEHAAEGRMAQSLQRFRHIEEFAMPKARHHAIVRDYMAIPRKSAGKR